jgi:hypothetical protein
MKVVLVSSEGWAKNVCIWLIQRVGAVVSKDVVDTLYSTASNQKSRSTSPRTTAIVRGPFVSIWGREVNDGRCIASG